MTFIMWASPRYVQEPATTILGPQNRTQGSCDFFYIFSAAMRECKMSN